MSVDIRVLRDAFLRAQYSGRDIPQLSDFRSNVPVQAVETIYLPFIAEEAAKLRQGFVLGPVTHIGYHKESERPLDVAGDAIVAGLLLSNMLSNGVWP
ncbi:hypothetical protein ERJ75_000730100 [Trypanosoma vivax]|uniref:Uncharacterized protein n=1 Tax=Trypanosoma vivax (strain Y486) TaxID=1055687 RepID=G0TX57_TRYVY|nr:hypothetical protein ERJ75_000730100 [Trypanosoma vivax]CCC48547.1 conserved hypothetical protein [Trypanosoma vivax Y486]